MPRVTFLPLKRTVEFTKIPFKGLGKRGSILDVAQNFGIRIEHQCAGGCVCTTCHVIIKKGGESLSPMSEKEADRLDMAEGLTLHSRLACQAVVRGDVTVEIPRR